MNLTKEKLLEFGWLPDDYRGFTFLRNGELVLIPMAGVWTLGRLIFGQPHIPFGVPSEYIFTEDDYARVMSELPTT
ncbi:hypothetical protein C8C83_3305 [Flavobacterium sp. 90]|uniref:hypothetical protein n=1 Tax=unclassified Flavobacterium TaxID=196869 RepID=UPI000EB14BCA|nr:MULTISPECIES: hypothetical protein [unclassified Flavobacterium]RKR11567.1 hypothetical protein C8C82_3616 [Flavobacterium sp. 81]TCK55348.1 hypothetical protein C8C83_3305 [Flavobacterium sp. 90]